MQKPISYDVLYTRFISAHLANHRLSFSWNPSAQYKKKKRLMRPKKEKNWTARNPCETSGSEVCA